MATLTEARGDLTDILEAGGVAIRRGASPPPYAAVYGGAVDLTTIVAGIAEAQYRVIALGGAWDAAAAQSACDVLAATIVGVMRAAPGWRCVSLGPDTIVDVGGSRLLGREVIVSTMIEV